MVQPQIFQAFPTDPAARPVGHGGHLAGSLGQDSVEAQTLQPGGCSLFPFPLRMGGISYRMGAQLTVPQPCAPTPARTSPRGLTLLARQRFLLLF